MSAIKSSDQIREEFFEFFQEKDHQLVPSASLVPGDDPTLLFTNAGMNQFKDVFLETGTRPYDRAVDTQKCLRVSGKHNDLEEVGLDTYHHTFFEMLGNWSFGDYFKREAIRWAWELLVEKWGLEPERLYATVHEGDEVLGLDADTEAADFWKSETTIDPDHVLFCPSKDNFWMMGDTGPCGPCSEIHVDLRSDEERAKVPGASLVNADDPRVMEIWNLVFIQYNSLGNSKLEALSAQHVDTGMGFERIVAVLQNKTSNYDTDLFSGILDAIAARSPVKEIVSYDEVNLPEEEVELIRIALRVIADHIRTVTFAIADGAAPGNAGRGYVIRRILRRAVRFGYQRLSFNEPFMYSIVPVLVEKMGHVFPEIVESMDYIQRVIKAEEEGFLETLGTGLSFFEKIVPYVGIGNSDRDALKARLLSDRQTLDFLDKAYAGLNTDEVVDAFIKSVSDAVIPGEIAFLLHDTYGFPIDLTQLMAREEGLGVDMSGYESLMSQQKTRARAAANFAVGSTKDNDWHVVSKGDDSVFVGYDSLGTDARVARYSTETLDDGSVHHKIVFDTTPFYAESGGQVGDTGKAMFGEEEVRILDTHRESGSIVHIVDRLPEEITSLAELRVDGGRRARIAKNHTATHLVHAALKEVLGVHIAQKGSLVAPNRLRFDFNHFEKVDKKDLDDIASLVNENIQRNITRQEDRDVPYDEAIARGATALFGEKYGDRVRVITFDPEYSVELCGGTHVGATGEIGLFRFLSEGSVASGIRRIEAITGMDAVSLINNQINELEKAKTLFKSSDESIDKELESLLANQKAMQKELGRLRVQSYQNTVAKKLNDTIDIAGINYASIQVDNVDMDVLRDLGTALRPTLAPETVVLLAGANEENDKAYLVAMVSDDMRTRINAGKFVGQVAKLIDGGGGGRPELATAGGNSPEKLDSALSESRRILEGLLHPVSN